MQLELSTVLLQWAAGGMLAGWVTTRHRMVGLGYGWLLRGVYGTLAGLAVLAGWSRTGTAARLATAGALATTAAIGLALAVSIARRRAGVRYGAERRAERSARVATMVGREPVSVDRPGAEFPPGLDLVAACVGLAALVPAAVADGGGVALTTARLLVGAAFLGGVTDAMLLGHWYLVQPGLPRDPLRELVVLTAVLWPAEVALYLVPPGMLSVLSGSVDDGYAGLLGWVWLVAALTTAGLLVVTWLALKERAYSAVMAATGLLYLAILTAFGTDLVARATLA